jgi:hypothetical protein
VTDAEPQPENPWWHPDELLAPGPSALVAFVLAVLVLMGGGLLITATLSFFGQNPGGSSAWSYIWATAIALLVPALASAYLAHRAITGTGTTGWELMLGRTALVLAVVGVGYTLILTLGSVIQLS